MTSQDTARSRPATAAATTGTTLTEDAMRARLDLGDCPLCATAIRPGDRIAVGRLGIGGPGGAAGPARVARGDGPLGAPAPRPGDGTAVGRLGIGGPGGSGGVPAAAHADCVRPLLPRPPTAGVPEMA